MSDEAMRGGAGFRRAVTGIVLVDKPSGSTSNRVLQGVKRLFAAEKAGHTGSLDPLATGMLPVCLGAATRVSGMLLGATKSYRVTVVFGIATDTGDADGAVVGEDQPRARDASTLAAALASFHGDVMQVPPMYSALKVEGRRLYELARRGTHVERAARKVTIIRTELEAVEWPKARFVLECSKGTYVRSFVEDVARTLGTLGHVVALRRLGVGPYDESQMVPLAELEVLAGRGYEALDRVLLPPDSALVDWPELRLDAEDARRVRHGQRLPAAPSSPVGRVRLYGPGRAFLGVGTVLASGELRPTRVFPS